MDDGSIVVKHPLDEKYIDEDNEQDENWTSNQFYLPRFQSAIEAVQTAPMKLTPLYILPFVLHANAINACVYVSFAFKLTKNIMSH